MLWYAPRRATGALLVICGCLATEYKMHNFIKGSCMTMCPLQEIHMREKERLLHRLELMRGTENERLQKADLKKTVKTFSRSAADMNMAIPHLIRPFDVLYKTVQYLLTEVLESKEVSQVSVYNFVWDRLRAVRQDMIIQLLPSKQAILLLEPMVIFYTFYGYKLCELPLSDFDPVLNKNQLMECLKQLLVCYDAIDEVTLADHISNLQLSDNTMEIRNVLSCNFDLRPLMESLYILCNLGDHHPLLRYLNLPKQYRRQSVKLSYQIAIENVRGNYVRVCRLANNLSPLAFCTFSLHLPLIQRVALEVLSHAYNSKQLTFPTAVLSHCVMFNSSEEARQVCSHYGLQCPTSQLVLFRKTDFKRDAKTLCPKKVWFREEPTLPFSSMI